MIRLSISNSEFKIRRDSPKLFKKFFILLGLIALYVLISDRLSQAVDSWKAGSNIDAVYFWGDSRLYRGIDLDLVRTITQRGAIGYANEGAGVYDFLYFVDQVPTNTDVVLGLGLPIFVRSESAAYDRSGFNIRALFKAVSSGAYSLTGAYKIFMHNRDFFRWAVKFRYLPYPNNKNPETTEMSAYKQVFNMIELPQYYLPRFEAIGDGIETLVQKGCRVFVFELPVTEQLKKMQESSIFSHFSEDLNKLESKGARVFSNVYIEEGDGNNFFDLSHLNERGREKFTKILLKKSSEAM